MNGLPSSLCDLEPLVAALYLRGLSRPVELRRSGWPAVERVLRSSGASAGSAVRALKRSGLYAEAMVLEAPGLVAQSERLVGGGRALTCFSPIYPQRWLRSLGSRAPPALWVRGRLPCDRTLVAVVGSRKVGSELRRFARAVGEEAVRLGHAVVSGGAAGCDRAAVAGAGPGAFEILPCGLSRRACGRVAQATVCAPDEPFSTATAMERNALVHAAAEVAVVVHARFKQGGTWHGVVEAIRRRSTCVAVRRDEADPASRALLGLGARPISGPGDLAELLEHARSEIGLFG